MLILRLLQPSFFAELTGKYKFHLQKTLRAQKNVFNPSSKVVPFARQRGVDKAPASPTLGQAPCCCIDRGAGETVCIFMLERLTIPRRSNSCTTGNDSFSNVSKRFMTLSMLSSARPEVFPRSSRRFVSSSFGQCRNSTNFTCLWSTRYTNHDQNEIGHSVCPTFAWATQPKPSSRSHRTLDLVCPRATMSQININPHR